VGLILQAAEAYNITVGGGPKYNVPSGNFNIDLSSSTPSQNLTSYTTAAICGADDFNDDHVTVKDIFNIIVNITREITPTCGFLIVGAYPFVLLTRPDSSRNHLGWDWVRPRGRISRGHILTAAFSATLRMDGRSVLLSDFPHSVISGPSIQYWS
jgi:hypothetical protein